MDKPILDYAKSPIKLIIDGAFGPKNIRSHCSHSSRLLQLAIFSIIDKLMLSYKQ